MVRDPDPNIAAPSEPDERESPAVSLQEAAECLGLTESEVLLRVFRGSLPSVVDRAGERRVRLDALAAFAPTEVPDGPQERPPHPVEHELLTAQIEALDRRLRDAYARITALESRELPSPPPEDDRFEAIAGDLHAARARIAALESRPEYPRLSWLRHWEACCRWLNLIT